MNLENSIVKDFTLKNQNGDDVSISKFRGKKVVIFFYPKDQSLGCTMEAKGFRDLKSDFDAVNTVILGISKDGADSHCSFMQKHDLNYDLLSDPDFVAAKLLDAHNQNGLLFKMKRVTVIIDENGKIIKHYEKATGSIHHSQEVLNFIESYQNKSS